jgi:ribosomal protein S18 acetylase RimI-like enzyme
MTENQQAPDSRSRRGTTLWHAARKLALHLLSGLAQQSLSIVASDRTEWLSRRPQDLAKSQPASSIRAFRDQDEAAVIALWRSTGLTQPSNDPHRDIERKRTVQHELFLVAEQHGKIVGSVMAGYDGHRGWINYLAVDPSVQRQGVGRALVNEVERLLARLGCPKLNLQVRRENPAVLQFYERLGFRVEDRVSFGKRLLSD